MTCIQVRDFTNSVNLSILFQFDSCKQTDLNFHILNLNYYLIYAFSTTFIIFHTIRMSQSLESLRSALYNNIHHTYQSFNIEKETLQRLRMEMIAVKFEANKPIGFVECLFCVKKKLHTIRAKPKGNKHFWIISNFKKHLLNVHKLKLKETAISKNEFNKSADSIQNIESSSASESSNKIQLVQKSISNNDDNDISEEQVHGEMSLPELITIDESRKVDSDASMEYNSYNIEYTQEQTLNDEIRPGESSQISLIGLEIEVDLHLVMYEQITEQLIYMDCCGTHT